MPPKKERRKKAPEDPRILKMIDREFYELEIQELNRKLARIQGRCAELEAEAENVRKLMEKMEEDRGDVISHLKRSLQKKVDEIEELTERIDALHQAKETENHLFKERIKNMESDFRAMQEQLSSEIKLLNGKLNSLEEFRANREELMLKFENQEVAMQEQDKKHDKELFEMEQAFLVRKERLREEMEARLLKLSLDFQKATQMRIASTTQSVIRENIAVNNELNILVSEWKNMSQEVEELKVKNKTLSLEADINEKYMKDIEIKNLHYQMIIKQLNLQVNRQMGKASELEQKNKMIMTLEKKLADAEEKMKAAQRDSSLATQRLQAIKTEYDAFRIKCQEADKHTFNLEKIIKKAVDVVKKLIGLAVEEGLTDDNLILKRDELLKALEQLLDLGISVDTMREASKETVEGWPCRGLKKASVALPVTPMGEHLFTKMEARINAFKVHSPTELYSQEEGGDGDAFAPDKPSVGRTLSTLLYIQNLEEIIATAEKLVKEIKSLPPLDAVKTEMLKKEIEEERANLVSTLFDLLEANTLQRTPRPKPMASLETVIPELELKQQNQCVDKYPAAVELSMSSFDWVHFCDGSNFKKDL